MDYEILQQQAAERTTNICLVANLTGSLMMGLPVIINHMFQTSGTDIHNLHCYSVTVQPFISYIHKPASELSVAALQLMFTHFRNERLFYHKKVLNNTMNKLIVLPIIFLWLNCYQTAKSITKKSSICHIRVLYLEGSVLLFTRKHISFQPMNL